VDRRGLAGSVASQERERAALGNVERRVADGDEPVLERLLEMLCLDRAITFS
jgi:hypothetical protein